MKIVPLVCALLAFPVLAAEVETTQVYIDNGQLEYVGQLDDAANRRLFDLYEKASTKPTVLDIRSIGGEVNAGMQLGSWVRARKLDVRVMEFCLSSCANYVFTAGLKKTVSNFALIGYHGGPGKSRFDASTQKMYDALDPAGQKAFMNEIASILARDSRREADYFKQIGVRADLSSLGQQPQYDALRNSTDAALWTYSLEGFAALGVRDITVINPPWKPGSAFRQLKAVTIPVTPD